MSPSKVVNSNLFVTFFNQLCSFIVIVKFVIRVAANTEPEKEFHFAAKHKQTVTFNEITAHK